MNNDKNTCYICFEPTNHKQTCECSVYVCKECLVEEYKYRKQCSICKTEIEQNYICSENNLSIFFGITSIISCISFVLFSGLLITQNKYNNFIEVIACGIIAWIILILICLLLFSIYVTCGVIILYIYNYFKSKLQLLSSSLG